MVEREELNRLLYEVFFETDKYTPLSKLKRYMKADGFEKDPGGFLANHYKVVYLPSSKPATVEVDIQLRPDALGHYLREIYEWCLESGYRFEDCDNPRGLWRFVQPWDGHWKQTYEELKDKQKSMFHFISMKYEEHRYGQKPDIVDYVPVPPAPPVPTKPVFVAKPK